MDNARRVLSELANRRDEMRAAVAVRHDEIVKEMERVRRDSLMEVDEAIEETRRFLEKTLKVALKRVHDLQNQSQDWKDTAFLSPERRSFLVKKFRGWAAEQEPIKAPSSCMLGWEWRRVPPLGDIRGSIPGPVTLVNAHARFSAYCCVSIVVSWQIPTDFEVDSFWVMIKSEDESIACARTENGQMSTTVFNVQLYKPGQKFIVSISAGNPSGFGPVSSMETPPAL